MRRLLLLAAVAAAARPALADEGCPEARGRLNAGKADDAELVARACLKKSPDDVAAWAVLARALAARQRYPEALSWMDKAVARFPADSDLAMTRVRILAWSGRLEDAWAALERLGPAPLADKDDALFAASLASWRKDRVVALQRYDDVIARWPNDGEALRARGIARLESGDVAGAEDDFRAWCRADPAGPGCLWAENAAEEHSRWRLRLAPGYIVIPGRQTGWNFPGEVDWRATDNLHVIASAERRTRDLGSGAVSDTFIEGSFALRLGQRLGVAGAFGATVDRQFSPRWTAEIEPTVGVGGGIELILKFWRLDFSPSPSASVVSPAINWAYEPWAVSVRYFLGLPDGGKATHSAFGRLARLFGTHVTAAVSGGGGNGLDYLEIKQGGSGQFWFVYGGLSYRTSWRHSFELDYVRRAEHTNTDSLTQHTLTLSYEVRF